VSAERPIVRSAQNGGALLAYDSRVKIGFIGLGQMGREMAGRLIDAGHELVVWNRTSSAAKQFETRARVANSPQEATDAEVVITMLADDAAIDEVWLKRGMKTSGVHLNMATVSLRVARELARLQEAYVSAPVFGRPPAAAKGELDVIAAGPAQALERCQPVFKALARQVFVVGTQPAQANAVKIARNFLLATVIEGLGEALALATRSGVDAARFVDILTSTSLAAPAYKNYGRLMVERAYEPAQFSMELGLKDVELALATARENGLRLPTGELIRKHLLEAIAQGHGHKDWAALAEFLVARGSG
jgi:3-hydroxyisobutyrate dehydrogenase-like beta-hydroxyacid dehydrogenase